MNGSHLQSKEINRPAQDVSRVRRRPENLARCEHDSPGLDDYNIGSQLKSFRKARNVTLQFVAAETGMSAALLSQIENGNVTPSLKTLSKLADYFHVRLGKLFDSINDTPKYEIYRKSDSGCENLYERLVHRNQGFCNPLLPFGPRKKMSCVLIDLRDDSGISAPASISGETFLYVIAGKIEIRRKDEQCTIEAGDSVYLENSVDIDVKPVQCSRARVLRVETT